MINSINLMKTVTIIIVILVFSVNNSIFSQTTTWIKTYGSTSGDTPNSVQQTTDGGYVMCGSTYQDSTHSSNFWIIKIDVNGDVQWDSKINYGGWNISSSAICIKQTTDGYIVVGNHYQDYTLNLLLVKLDENGNEVWNRNLGNWSASSIQVTQDGGYIITGSKMGVSLWLTKTDSNGNEEWNVISGTVGSSNNYAKPKVKQTSDGGYIVSTRNYISGSGTFSAWMIKFDAVGNEEWNRIFGTDQFDEAFDVIQTNDGGYAITCMTNFLSPYWYEYWLIKTDSDGNEEWSQTYGTTDSDKPYSLIQTSDGGYIMLGFSGRNSEFSIIYSDLLILKTDESGNEIWREIYGEDRIDYGIQIIHATDGGYLLLGITNSFGAGSSDFWLIKTDESGNVGIEESNNLLSDGDYQLNQNYPNPFNPTTKINYQLTVSSKQLAEIVVYNAIGQKVWSQNLSTDHSSLVTGSITFDGSKFNSGIYYYSLVVDGKKLGTKSMILIK